MVSFFLSEISAASGPHLAVTSISASLRTSALRAKRSKRGVTVSNLEFVAITNDVLTDIGKHYLTVWMRGDAHHDAVHVGDRTEITEAEWFYADQLPTPLHLYFRNLLEGNCWPRSPNNLQFIIHTKA
jgi:ADP-ribose pyrophosphatase YjhB (NUDIX family)